MGPLFDLARKRTTLAIGGVVAALAALDTVLSLIDRWDGQLDFPILVDVARAAAGPVALLVVLLALWRERGRGHSADQIARPEWDSQNQVGHWNGVQRLVADARKELRDAIATTDITVRDHNNLRNLADSVDLQVSSYSDLWTRGSYWDDRSRTKWDRSRAGRYTGPEWAEPLWRRVNYAAWWMQTHDPLTYESDPGYELW